MSGTIKLASRMKGRHPFYCTDATNNLLNCLADATQQSRGDAVRDALESHLELDPELHERVKRIARDTKRVI